MYASTLTVLGFGILFVLGGACEDGLNAPAPRCGKNSLREGQQCCNGELQPLSDEKTNERRHCCGFSSYVSSTHRCCNRALQPLYDDKTKETRHCCGVSSYVNSTHRCFLGRVWPKTNSDQPENRCGDHDPLNKLCCNGELHNKKKNLICCGTKAINKLTHRCIMGVDEAIPCPAQQNNVTDTLWSTHNVVAVNTIKDRMENKYTILDCPVRFAGRCNKKEVSIEVDDKCSIREALKSGETLVITVTGEIGDKLELTSRHAWAFCPGCSSEKIKKMRRLARKKWRG